MTRISNEIFTKISLTSLILPYYAKPQIWHNLMVSLRKKSWEIWIKNYKRWWNILSEYMEKVRLFKLHLLEPINELWKELFYKYTYKVKAFTPEIKRLTNILKKSKAFYIEWVSIEFPKIDDKEYTDNEDDLEIILKDDDDNQLKEFIDDIRALWTVISRHKEQIENSSSCITIEENIIKDSYGNITKLLRLPDVFIMSIHRYSRSNIVIYDSQCDIAFNDKEVSYQDKEMNYTKTTQLFIQNRENLNKIIEENIKSKHKLLSTKNVILINWDDKNNIFDSDFDTFTNLVKEDWKSLEEIKIWCNEANNLSNWDKQIKKLADIPIKTNIEYSVKYKTIYYIDTILSRNGILIWNSPNWVSKYHITDLTVKFSNLIKRENDIVEISDISELNGTISLIQSEINESEWICINQNDEDLNWKYTLEIPILSIIEYTLNLLPKIKETDKLNKINKILEEKLDNVSHLKCQLKLDTDQRNLIYWNGDTIENLLIWFFSYLEKSINNVDIRQILYKIFAPFSSELILKLWKITQNAKRLRRFILNLESKSERENKEILEYFRNIMKINKSIMEISTMIKFSVKSARIRKEIEVSLDRRIIYRLI